MLTTNRASNIRLKFLVSGLCALLVVALATLPTQTASALPPRPTPVTPTPTSMPASTSPGWAVIELHVQPTAQSALWTVVQWQDRPGRLARRGRLARDARSSQQRRGPENMVGRQGQFRYRAVPLGDLPGSGRQVTGRQRSVPIASLRKYDGSD